MIGLVDYDWFYPKYKDRLIPNLEIMKLATYYHFEEKKFCRLLTLEETELDQYQTIYFFSETGNNIIIPPQYLRAKNVIYGGTAFTKGIYKPFENSIIDYTIAKPFIYKEFLKKQYQDGTKAKVITHVLDDSYYRMKSGNDILPIPPVIPKKRIYIYDRNIFIPHWKEIFSELVNRRPSVIIPIHPIYCNKITDYFALRNEHKFNRTAEFILDLNIPLEECHYLFKKYTQLFLADITVKSKIYILLGGSFQSQLQYINDFIYKMNLLYLFWSQGIPIKIQYQIPDIIYNNPLYLIEQLIETWTNNKSKDKKTLNEYLIANTTKENKNEIQSELELIFSKFLNARDLLKYNYTILNQQKFWRI